MKFHRFLFTVTFVILLSSQLIKAQDDDDDYDDGFELQNVQEPDVEIHQPPAEEIKKEHHKVIQKIPQNVADKKVSISNVGIYIPVGIIAALTLNVVAIAVVMTMKRRRAQVVYSKMERDEAAVELKETVRV